MTKKRIWNLSLCLMLVIIYVSIGITQEAQKTDVKEDIWEAFRILEGKWIDEKPGVSKVTQVYEFIMRGKYLQMRTKAVFEPSEKNPQGEVHEDLGIFSYDQTRKAFVFRQFHIEGFVNTYILKKKDSVANELIFLSEQIENAPEGTKAKEIFKLINEDEVEQSFHIAWPGREYACFSLNNLKRVK